MPFSEEVNEYINAAPVKYRIILSELRNLIHEAVDGTDEVIKEGFPVFTKNRDFSYIRLHKHHVTLGFYNFTNITEQTEKLKGSDETKRHVKLKKVEEIDHELFSRWLKQVAE
ncbi:MAG TPA: DUF1801 domain-containing protein [Thermotogota bacterium]|nr:DUF1801 domain-containing protein [Thermotogota bacterium]